MKTHSSISQFPKWLWMGGGLFALVLLAFVISTIGIYAGLIFLLLSGGILFFVITYRQPITSLYILLVYCFFLFALDRYFVKGAFPVGFIVDILLIYTYTIIFLKSFSEKVEWKNMSDAPIIVFIIWALYLVSTLFNPQSPGFTSWLIGVRPFLYMIFSVPLFCLLLHKKQINIFLICWGILSILMTLKGFIQLNIRLDTTERILLAGSMRNTHLLFGQLRVFSFLSDAGQFGASQACAGLCGAILFLGEKQPMKRLFYLLMCLTGVYGMFISGTRGAMFVLIVGGVIYLFLVKNIKLLLIGLLCGGAFIYFMMFTYIGHDNYNIRRMRSAFQPEEDASYVVRKSNQQLFKAYLADRPFGEGIGSMYPGVPGTFLGETPPDSGFVLIWGEQGIVGVCLFISILIYILLKGTYLVWFEIKNDWLRTVLIAMIAGIAGMSIAHYGGSILFQHPSAMLFFFFIAVIFSAQRIDKELTSSNEP